MRNWRIISTIAAVVFAAIAGVLVWKYLSNADSRAEKKKDLVEVLVAKNRIARGTVFDRRWPTSSSSWSRSHATRCRRTRSCPTSDETLLATYKTRVAATDIYQGTPLVSDQFVGASQLVSTVAGAIPKGKQAITISLDQTHSVGGFVTPGDKRQRASSTTRSSTTRATRPAHKTTAFLLPGVKVIAVGSSTVLPQAQTTSATGTGDTTTTQPQAQPSSLITLQVTPRQAEQIVQGTTLGTVWLSLNPPDFAAGKFVAPTEIVDEINLFNQSLTQAQRRAGQVQDLPTPADLVP